MKKFGLATVGVIAAIIVLGNLGSLLALAISVLLAYAGFHYFRKTNSSLKKFFWGTVLLIGLLTAISNIPAFIGILALIAVYYIWKKWHDDKEYEIITHSTDPFENFEREWNNITK